MLTKNCVEFQLTQDVARAPLWWSSGIRSLLWVVLCLVNPTYTGFQDSVDH